MAKSSSNPSHPFPGREKKEKIAAAQAADLGKDEEVSNGERSALAERSIGLLQRVQLYQHLLSPAERQIADYLQMNPQQILNLPIDQLARNIGVGMSTLSQFCRALGYKGFKELKLDLATELKTPFQLDRSLIGEGDKLEEIAQKTMSANIDALLSTLKHLDFAALTSAITALRAAQRIDLYGFGISSVVALDAYNRFFSLGLRVNWLPDMAHQTISAALLRAGDVALAISYSGESELTAHSLKQARQNGATTIAITGNASSPTARQADILLLAYAREPTPFISNLYVSARTAMQTLIDTLYLGLLYTSKGSPEQLEQTSAMLEKLSQYPGP